MCFAPHSISKNIPDRDGRHQTDHRLDIATGEGTGKKPLRATGPPAPPVVPLLVPSITSYQDFKIAICMLVYLVVAHRQPVEPDVARPSEGTYSLRVREFISLNPLQFTGTDRKEGPQHIVDQLHKIFKGIHALAELAAF
ncbi:hypothetical protein KY284_018581 [Solanum tuberosum]|nr:hypothetical protein KY284_018581 [Solanum tuberosum]